MKLLLFSDVHGNLPALELMLDRAGEVDGYICLGDMVNYGPWSNECVDVIGALPNAVVLEGNHEQYFLGGQYGGVNAVAQKFFDFCFPGFARRDQIAGLRKRHVTNGYTFQHTIGGKYIYSDSAIELDRNYVIGHSHHQFKRTDGNFTLINPGSVGQNRKYINVVNFVVLETTTMGFEFQAVTYDVEAVISEMSRRGYPEECLRYYDGKLRWTGKDAGPGPL